MSGCKVCGLPAALTCICGDEAYCTRHALEGFISMLEKHPEGGVGLEKFAVTKDISVELRDDRAKPPLWAVTQHGCVLNTEFEWEYEPLPSSRTDEFKARTRFPIGEALKRAYAEDSVEK